MVAYTIYRPGGSNSDECFTDIYGMYACIAKDSLRSMTEQLKQ